MTVKDLLSIYKNINPFLPEEILNFKISDTKYNKKYGVIIEFMLPFIRENRILNIEEYLKIVYFLHNVC